MGRNNRDRRKQKKAKKNKIASTATAKARSRHIPQHELEKICRPAIVSLNRNEPPPPSVMESWASHPVCTAAKPLRSLLVGFIDFLFHGDIAKGDLASLKLYQQPLKKTELASLYPILHAYCLISSSALSDGDVDPLIAAVTSNGLPFDERTKKASMVFLYAPFYLLLWVMGRLPESSRNVIVWLNNWLKGPIANALYLPLKKFLALKNPKPEQKTVQQLETVLENLALDEDEEWFEGLHLLLTLFLQQRLSQKQRQSKSWQQCPQLSRLAGLVDRPVSSNWSQLKMSEASTATLNRLDRLTDTTSMPYREKLSLEALRCRLLSQYANAGEIGEEDFFRQFESMIHLMSVRVPEEHREFTERCLEVACEWVAQEVGYGRVPPVPAARLRGLLRLRPNDYRVVLMNVLAHKGRTVDLKSIEKMDFQHVHFPLFFRALSQDLENDAILDRFYWPLTGEAKKSLFVQCCQKLFLSMEPFKAGKIWRRWRQPLFDVTQAPFKGIVSGQACEADMLFYTAIVAVDTGYGIHWLQPDHLAPLIRTGEQLLNQHDSDFSQERVVGLLTALSAHPDVSHLFQSWEQVMNLIHKIDHVAEMEEFLRMALDILHQQTDTTKIQQEALYAICRSIPALRRHLKGVKNTHSARKSATAKKTHKKNPKAKPHKLSPKLDILGGLQ